MKHNLRKFTSFLTAFVFLFSSSSVSLLAENIQTNPTEIIVPTARPEDVEAKMNETPITAPQETTTDFLMEESPLSEPTPDETNHQPVAASSTRKVTRGDTMSSQLSAGDADRDQLVFELVEGPKHGELKIEKDGSYSYTAKENYLGEDGFTYRVFDGTNYSEAAKVVLNITDNPVERITHSIVIQAIQVCDDQGNNCQNPSMNLFEEVTAKIWEQAGIAFDYLPFVKYLDSSALKLSQINAMNLKPVWDYGHKILNLFFVDTIEGARGLSDFDGLMSVISSLATPSTIAHEIGNNLGLLDTTHFDPLNLMNSGSRTLEIPQITDEQFLEVFTFPRWLKLTAEPDARIEKTIDSEEFVQLTNVHLKGERFTYAIAEAPKNEDVELYYQTVPYREGLWIKAKNGNVSDQFSYFAINEKGEKELITVDLKVHQGNASGSSSVPKPSLESLNLIPASGLKLLGEQQELFFSGKNHFEIAHQDNFLLEEGAVSLWFNAEDPNTFQGLLSKELRGMNAGDFSIVLSNGEISVKFEDGTRTYWMATDGNKLRSQGKDAPFSIHANTWHNVTVTFGKEGVYLYLDGKKQMSKSNYTGGLKGLAEGLGNRANMVIGAISEATNNSYVNNVSGRFSGDIHGVTIFNRIPTAEEIQQKIKEANFESQKSLSETPKDGILLAADEQDFSKLKPQELAHQNVFDSREKTLSFWLETQELSEAEQGLFAKDRDFSLSLKNDTLLLRLNDGDFTYNLSSGRIIQPHTRHQVTVEMGEKRMMLYVDGVLIANKAFPEGALKNRVIKQDTLLMGARWGYAAKGEIKYRHPRDLFKGKLSDIQIFDRLLSVQEIQGILDPVAAPFRNSSPSKDTAKAYRPIADGTSPDVLIRAPKDSGVSSVGPMRIFDIFWRLSKNSNKSFQSNRISSRDEIETPESINLFSLNPSIDLMNLQLALEKEMSIRRSKSETGFDPKDLYEFTANQIEIKSVGRDFLDDIMNLKKTLQEIYLEAVFQLKRGGIHKQLKVHHEIVQAQQTAQIEGMAKMKLYQDILFFLSMYYPSEKMYSLFQLLFSGDNPMKSPYYQQIRKGLLRASSEKSTDIDLRARQKIKALALLHNKEPQPLSNLQES